MVIVCPECSTKFRVNPERISDNGTKVRCARCKHIFIAAKPAAETKPVPVVAEASVPPEVPTQPADLAPPEKSSSTSEQVEDHSTSAGSDESSFSYDQFRDLDATQPEADEFTFSGEQNAEDMPATNQAAASTDAAPLPEDSGDKNTFRFSGSADEPPTEDAVETNATESTAAAPDEANADIFSADEEASIEPEFPAPPTSKKKSSPAASISRILLLLILSLVIIGGALYLINGPEQIEQVIQQIFGQQTSGQIQPDRIALTNLEGKFINNQEAGELFVIRGEATNNFKEPRASIQVKGVIFDKDGNPLLQKTIFCGNPISDQELQTLSFSKLEEMMGNQFGKSLKNMKINSAQAIPFVIAFRDLPKNLSEFSVDVTSSKPAAQ